MPVSPAASSLGASILGGQAKRLTAGLISSLLVALPLPSAAAQQLQLQLDGLELSVDLTELEAWSQDPERSGGDLRVWLSLLDPTSREGLVRLLQAPLLEKRSFGLQLLSSWTGERILDQVGALITTADGRSTGALLQSTLRQVLRDQNSVTALELLKAVPTRQLVLRLDALLSLAQQWPGQIALQRDALSGLQWLNLPRLGRHPAPVPDGHSPSPRRLMLKVVHRSTPLAVEVWPSQRSGSSPWVLLMPGLGGDPDQLGWLAAALADRGWPVVVLEHPGSDAKAMQASLDGKRPPPGAESLPDRLADLQAVLSAGSRGELGRFGPGQTGEEGVVLMGHSLGALTALLGAGLKPEDGLERRCRRALERLPLTNPSQLLQCQIQEVPELARLTSRSRRTPVTAVVGFNSFGALLWPRAGLKPLRIPVMLVGGSLDLITPAINEQLRPFTRVSDPRSRLVLIQGASHFSPVRIPEQNQAVFQLGEDLVGVEPRRVQNLLLNLTVDFLLSLEQPQRLSPQERSQEGIRAWVLDRRRARDLLGWLPRDPDQP
ncbi:MAG: alpha/beta fold hydrolase [Cyanobacteriota bacterium]|nr:alpha/beta fold hydrolase [Cyanobacteriota bacterium]